MKNHWISIVSLFLTIPALGLTPGDAVTLDALAKAEAIQGELPESWKEGDLYILECWATWCGPCVAAIPHVDALYDKYRSKGLRVIGINVLEDGKDKVEKFVERKGDGMSYPVAYVGKGGEFEETWLKAAGVRGIPNAFVVKNGKLLFRTHPFALEEEMIEGLLADGDRETAVIEKALSDVKQREAMAQTTQAFNKARTENDTAGMAAAILEMEKINPKQSSLLSMRSDLALFQKDWAKVEELLSSSPNPRTTLMIAYGFLRRIDAASIDGVPVEFQQMLIDTISELDKPERVSLALVARTQWRLGQKDHAKATAEKAASLESEKGSAEPFKKFVESFEGGNEPMSMQQLMQLVIMSMRDNPKSNP